MASYQIMPVAVHKIFEPPSPGGDLGARKSVWVCLGPSEGDMWHAEDHPNAVLLCHSVPEAIANDVADGIEALLAKIAISYSVEEYPGD